MKIFFNLFNFNFISQLICLILLFLFLTSCNNNSPKESKTTSGDSSESLTDSSLTPTPPEITTQTSAPSDPVSPEVEQELEKAKNALLNSDLTNAKNILNNLCQKHPELPPSGIILTQFFAQTKNSNIIKTILDTTANENPNDPEAYIILAEIALQQKELTAAELLLKEAESKLIHYSINQSRKKNLTSYLLRIQSSLAEIRGRWKSYESLADKRINHDGLSNNLLRQKGIALFQQNKDSEAEKLFLNADNLNKNKPQQNNNEQPLPAEALMSQLYAKRGNIEKSKQFLNAALGKYPNSKDVILLSIQSRLNENKPEEAQPLAAKLLKDFPDFKPAKKILATIALYLNDYNSAEKLFQELIIDTPSDSQAINGLALALCEQNDTKKLQRALDYAKNNVNKDQQNPESWSVLGWILFKANQIENAKQALQRSIVSGQISPATAFYLANIEKLAGNTENAKQLLTKALQANSPFAKRKDAEKLLKEL